MKKHITAVLALLAPILCIAQKADYTLTAKLNTLKVPSKAYLVYSYGWTNQRVLDSAEIKKGTFLFKGNAEEPVKVDLVIGHNGQDIKSFNRNADALLIYLENGNIAINGTDSVKTAKITGSKLNTAYAQYHAAVLAPADKVGEEISAAYKAAPAGKRDDNTFRNDLMLKMKKAVQQRDSLKYIYIKQNSDSYLSLLALTELAGNNPDVYKIEPVFKKLSTDIRNTKAGKDLANLLYDLGPTAIGAIAPDFTQNDMNDKPVKLSDFKGKYVLLDFWASWCGPCRGENPNVVKAYNKYKDKNFTVLGVSLDQPGKKAAWLAAIKKDGLTWTQVSDLQFWNNVVARKYAVRSIPQNFLIDPSGKIVAKNLRGEALDKKLEELLAAKRSK